MKVPFLLIISIFVAVTFHSFGAEVGSLPEFKSVVPISGGIKLTFSDSGVRFNYKIDNQPRQISVYGESVSILFTQSVEFVAKGLRVAFKPLANQPSSFQVERNLDLTSFGGADSTEFFTLTSTSGQLAYGEKSSRVPSP